MKSSTIILKSGLTALVMAATLAAPLSHAGGIAVIDSQKVLEESVPAKAFEKKSQKKYSPQINALKKLEEDIRDAVTKFERDAATMSESERTKKQLDVRRKQEDYQFQRRSLEQEIAQAQQAELQRLMPKLEQAVTSVAKSGNYDVIIEARAASYTKPGLDVTAKVIDKLNALTK